MERSSSKGSNKNRFSHSSCARGATSSLCGKAIGGKANQFFDGDILRIDKIVLKVKQISE